MLKKLFENQKGSAILMAIMGFAILSMFTMTAIFMGSSNARQTQREGKRTQAYYVADTGARALIKQFEDTGKYPADKLKEKLDKLSKEAEKSGEYKGMKFDIEVVKPDPNKDEYQIISTGYVDGIKDGTIALLKLEDKGGGGYEMGDGKIFINNTSQVEIPKLLQLKDSGVSLYTRGKRHLNSASSIFLSDDTGPIIKDLFLGLDSRKAGDTVENLNNQRKGNYGLEIIETTNGKTLDKNTIINSNNLIKREILKRYVSKNIDAKQDSTFEQIEFNYELQKEEVLKYFSYGELPNNKLSNNDLEDTISKLFLLPIKDKKDYEEYLKGSEIFPLQAYKKPSKIDEIENAIVLNGKDKILDFRDYDNILINGEIQLQNSSTLTIQVADGANVYIDGRISTSDSSSSKKDKIKIKSEGKANFHVKTIVDFDGDLIADSKDGGVNFYVYGDSVQINNKTNVKNINLYAPKSTVNLGNNIVYEGVIVGKDFEFNDTAQFKAPSKGSASSSMNKEMKIAPVEWKEWQR